ncbi:IpaD/SipD/SspD family type III secretion system needle tip protein [Salmonella enterica]|nr:IpaD/SipD/SspD family type III secretion system needle tip protein [Salmonella enterica]EDX5193561.1 IpaD/SipD/SspD family type III secretion system needle tip protein [Salmonella enterica subsp. enterica serovar Glostrup]EJB9811029.1 IpaD/SipD/SspD family type III secretion system needle tip protein [Salmonella enterica]
MDIVIPLQNHFLRQHIIRDDSVRLAPENDYSDNASSLNELLKLLFKIDKYGINDINHIKLDELQKRIEAINYRDDHFLVDKPTSDAFILNNKKSVGYSPDKINNQLVNDRLVMSYNYKNLLNSISIAEQKKTSPKDPEVQEGGYAEFWKRISGSITSIKKNYVDVYADLMQKYVIMYQDYNDTVVSAAAKAVEDKSNEKVDSGKMRFTPSYIKDAFAAFSTKYSAPLTSNDNVLAQKDCGTKGDLNDFKEEYNLKEVENQLRQQYQNFEPAFKVYARAFFDTERVDDDEGRLMYYNIKLRTTSHVNFNFPKWPLDNLPDDNCTISSYQAWLASFNAFGNQLQSNMQSFAQTYSQVNSTFNNLNKVLSSTITALGESANFVLKSLS